MRTKVLNEDLKAGSFIKFHDFPILNYFTSPSAVLGYAEPSPAPHAQYCPPHHVGVQCFHLPPNVDQG